MDRSDGEYGASGDLSIELLEVVAGTPHRWSILQVVRRNRYGIRDISDVLSIPRTTLRHNLNALVEAELLEQTVENEYRLTTLGNAVLHGLEAFHDHVETADNLEPFLDCVPPSRFDLDIAAFEEATITVASKPKPHAPGHRLLELFDRAETVTAFMPTLPPSKTRLRDSLAADDTRAELYVTDGVAGVIRSLFATERDVDSIQIVQREPSFAFGQTDETAFFLGLDELEKPHALVECESEACREWVDSRLSEYREQSTRSHLQADH